MNTRSKMKNIFINLFLALSMVLSVFGSAFLLKPYTKKTDAAGAESSALPSSLKFTASKSKAQVSDYSTDLGFEYVGDQLNYISANNILYFYDIPNNKLYTDPDYLFQAKDVTYTYDENNQELAITKRGDLSSTKYKLFNDVYMVEYSGSRYFLKNGVLYNDVNCTDNKTNLSYEVEFIVNCTSPAISNAHTELEKSSIGTSAVEYYKIIGQFAGKDYYIKPNETNHLYYLETGLVKNYEFDDDNIKITPHKIHIYSASMNSKYENTINEYIEINNRKYYVYNNELYETPVFEKIILPTDYKYYSISADSITVDIDPTETDNTTTLYKVNINETFYYVVKSDSTNSLYNEDGTKVDLSSSDIDFDVLEITDSQVTTRAKDYYQDNIEQDPYTGEIKVKYYLKNKSISSASNTYYAANINGTEYYFLKGDTVVEKNKFGKDTNRVFNSLGANITNQVDFTVSDITNDTTGETVDSLLVTFSLNGSNLVSFKRFGDYELLEEMTIDNADSSTTTYNKVIIENETYYVIKNDENKKLYSFTPADGGVSGTMTETTTSGNFEIDEITDNVVKVIPREYFYIGTVTNTILSRRINFTPILTTTYGDNVYEISDDSVTIEINTTSAEYVQGFNPSVHYYPITIHGETYYIFVNTANTSVNPKLVTITEFLTGTDIVLNNQEVTDFSNLGFSGVNITQNGNLISVELLNVKNLYTFHSDKPKKLNAIPLINKNNFISYTQNYYYYNGKLYLNSGYESEFESKDFTYDITPSKVLLENVYYDIQSASYKYVDIFENRFYYNETDHKLYSNIIIGGDELLSYQNEISPNVFAYKVDSDRKVISIFTSSSGAAIDYYEDTNTSDGLELIGTVLNEDDSYYISSDSKLYTTNGLVPYEYVNVDYNIRFSSSEKLFNEETIITINNTQYSYSATNGEDNTFNIFNDGKTILINTNVGKYVLFTTNTENTNLYYHKTSSSDIATIMSEIIDSPSSNDIPVILSIVGSNETSYTNEALSDYLVVGLNINENNTISGSVIFSNDTNYYSGSTYNYNNNSYTIDETNKTLTSEYGIDASLENFSYSVAENNTKIVVNSKYDKDNSKFLLGSNNISSEILNYNFQYFQTSKYNIVGRYESNNKNIEIYNNVEFNRLKNYTGNAITENGVVNATNVTIKYQEKAPYEVLNYISATYTPHESFSESTKFGNNSIVMLDNYLTKSAFLKEEVGSSGQEIDIIYLGFGEQFTIQEGEVPTTNYGITSLNVQGFLKNEYVMKYFKTTGSYNEYGVNLNINSVVEENVNYSSQTSNNRNIYWYQRLDLTNLEATIDYTTEDGEFGDDDKTGILTEQIIETSGLYTFVFNYVFVDGNSSKEGSYTFSFYLSENSDYIEYPMFNTMLTESNSQDITDSANPYYSVVSDVTGTQSNMSFAYNNQRFDKPTYIYDATKFNVSYSYKYNLESHNYTTNFVVKNSGLSNEYGWLEIYRDSNLFKTYRINSKKFSSTADERVANGIAIDYYLDEAGNNLYGSLFIKENGNHYLSLENYYYYNKNNRTFYSDEADYYTNGRLIKNGATNTPESYYMVMVFEDLGDYTFTNKYLIAKGNINNESTNYYQIVDNGQSTTDTLQGKYTFEDVITSGNDITLTSGAISRFAHYTDIGEYILPKLTDIYEFTDEGKDKDTLIPYYTGVNANPTLKIFGITTTFNKPVNNVSQEISFNKIDENIYSDITPKTTFKDGSNNNFEINNLIESSFNIRDMIDNNIFDGTLKFYNEESYKYHVPLTNLQPIYFRYFGDFNYNNSFYYRFQKCNYTIDEYGMLQSVDFTNAERSKVNFTNKTSISSSGFYIVDVQYYSTDATGSKDPEHQYFMFAIDNSAPNLKIFTQNTFDGSDKTLFISSTEFSQTSRYTNKQRLSATWNTPNYFQGEINVSYVYSNYDETQISAPVSYTKDTSFATENGKYTFTINYGVNGISSTSTYIIVDKVTPTGELYQTFNSNETYYLGEKTTNRIFNSPVTFVSPTKKSASGAKISARITSISLNSYSDYSKAIDESTNKDGKKEYEAITTNVEIDATNSLFNDNLDSSPIYNYFNFENAEEFEDSYIVKKSQLLGLSDEPMIYIVKLYDEAGNYEISYFIYDNSTPYILYRVSDTEEFVTSFENNTTQANTEIIWNKYKAIHIKDDGTTRSLYDGFKSAITSDAYNGIFIKQVNGEYYLYVPINYASLESEVMENNVNARYIAKTTGSSSNYRKQATIFIDTTNTKNEPNAITQANPKASFNIYQKDNSNVKLSNYSEFFKGNKSYTIQINDAVGNNLNKRLILNSSFAQETFFGFRTTGSTAYTLSAYNAYNVGRLTTQYKNLMDSQSFYAKISYDYYNINFENYLRANEDAAIDEGLTSYSTFGYDLENYIVYMFDSSSGQFVERGAYNTETQSYSYKYNDFGAEDDHFYTYEELSSKDMANGKFYLPGYPYVLSGSDVVVNTTIDNSGSQSLCVSNTIYEENKSTKEGLYIFKRSYVDIASGNEITQDQIASGAEELKVLENDRAIRYYVFYVDRNGIIELTYDSTGIVDIINSIGNLLEINLGEDRDGKPDPVINAEVLNSSGADLEITTNKLKVITDFSLDKYATTEKLTALRKYDYTNDSSLTINEIGEDLSIQRNIGTFKYYVTINNGIKDIIKDNVIVDSGEVKALTSIINNGNTNNNATKTDFSLWVGHQYILTITDNTFVYDNNTGVKVDNSANQKVFKFRITHSSPEGSFITLVGEGETKAVKELLVRENETVINETGTTKTFVSSNAENLSFTFSDSESEYDATINPYSIEVYSVPYESQNAQGVELFKTNYSKNSEYYNTFGGSLIKGQINNSALTQVLQIFDRDGNDIKALRVDNGAPYTYRINIFDKSKETESIDGVVSTPLLALASDDRVYIVKVKYVGNNDDGDYVIKTNDGDLNYFETTFKIHIDRVAPKENLNNLINSDPNLDFYCTSKYGTSYEYLTKQQKQEVLTSYAFPVRYIEEENIEHYYAKDFFGSSYNSISNEKDKTEARLHVLNNYSTLFNQNHDDSERLFVMSVGTTITEYKHSVLPTEEGYSDGGSYNGHERFSEGKPDVYVQFDYEEEKFYFSNYITQNYDNKLYFDNAYYEIIEQDEAGNLTRYLVYATDNTNVEVDFRYINSENDNVDKDKDGNIDNSYYFIHNDVKYYVIDGFVGEKIGDAFRVIDKEPKPKIHYTKYYHNYNSKDGAAIIEEIPTSVEIDGCYYELIGSKKVGQSYSDNDPFEVLNLSSIHFLNQTPEGVDDLSYAYLFDDFFTVKIYTKANRPGAQFSLSETFSSDPYSENYSTDKFLQNVTNEFRNLVAINSANTQNKVYEYKIEIINRFGYNNYTLSFNLPDQNLKLTFTNPTPDTLTVKLPDASTFVKIMKFNVYVYQDKQWKSLTTDSTGKIIQTVNADNYDAGLSSTTYTFTAGQYRFVTWDNYNRGNNNGLGEYKIVGANIDDTYSISYSRPHITDENDVVITSGTMSILINDSIYQLRVTLKNAVKVTKISDNTTEYYSLVSEGETTKLYKFIDGVNDKQVYYNSAGSFVTGYTDGVMAVYYYRGKLYSDTQYKKPIELVEDYVYTVIPNTTSQYIYSPGNTVNDKTYFTMNTTCENSIGEYQIRINWTTDPNNYEFINLKIDRTLPKLILLNESGSLAAVENQNYNKPFTISWNSDYSTTATLVRTIDSVSQTIRITASDNYEINTIAGYTLTIIDEIGNQLIFNFNFVENANEYFSVLVNEIEILPSDYVSTYGTSGKTIRYYYYDNTNNPTVTVKTDETKNIGKLASDGDSEYDYEILRTNINYTICYVKLIPVAPTSRMLDFLEGISFTKKDGLIENIPVDDNFEITYMKNQEYDSFTLNVNKNLSGSTNPKLIGDKIYVQHYYNNKLVRTYSSDSWAQLVDGTTINKDTATFPITLSSTGEHRFEFRDFVGNTTSSLSVTLIKDIIFTANNENPIDYRFYNSDVVIDVPNTEYYNDVIVTAKLNGVEINTDEIKQNTRYTFSTAGSYEVYMKAQNADMETYESKYFFTIINKNVTKMTFGFSNSYGFTIHKVVKNQADITDLITSESKDSMWLTSGDKDAIGTYTITLLGYDKLSNNYLPFTFVVKLNNEIPSIMSQNYKFGTKTTKAVTFQYNPAVIYSQVGESYIRIIGDNGIDERIEINADSLDEITNFTIGVNGKYRVTIYNKDGIFIASYAIHKAAPLNTSAKIIIIVVVIVVIALTVTFIILRRHTKFR